MGKETASSSCAYKTGSLPPSTLPPGNRMSKEGPPYSFYSPLPVYSSPSISILHLYHQHTILLKVVVVTDDVRVVKHRKNLGL